MDHRSQTATEEKAMKTHIGKLSTGLMIVLLLAAAAAPAAPPVSMEGTAIIGEQERPQIHFTIPWQAGAPVRPITRPWLSLITRRLAPIDREIFQQQLQWEQRYQSDRLGLPPIDKGE